LRRSSCIRSFVVRGASSQRRDGELIEELGIELRRAGARDEGSEKQSSHDDANRERQDQEERSRQPPSLSSLSPAPFAPLPLPCRVVRMPFIPCNPFGGRTQVSRRHELQQVLMQTHREGNDRRHTLTSLTRRATFTGASLLLLPPAAAASVECIPSTARHKVCRHSCHSRRRLCMRRKTPHLSSSIISRCYPFPSS
jgi:hypothetical protein